MPQFHAYTDGACSGNPGPGGWGVLLIAFEGDKIIRERTLSGGAADTTNNQMELMAAIMALETLSSRTKITLITDSAYVKDGITRWIKSWKANGWRRKGKAAVKNLELWKRLEAAESAHDVSWQWVKGHAGDAGNERADALACKGMSPFTSA